MGIVSDITMKLSNRYINVNSYMYALTINGKKRGLDLKKLEGENEKEICL